jgi:hypothetical protein
MQSASFYIFILIYASIVTTIYYKFEIKSSFNELNKIFAFNEPNEYRKNLNYLLQNLNNKTDVEFAIYNSKFGKKLSFISFMLASFFLFTLTEYGRCLIFLFIGLILFIPEIYIHSKKVFSHDFLKQNSIQNVVTKWSNLVISFMSNHVLSFATKYLKLILYNFTILIFIFIVYIFLQNVLQPKSIVSFDGLLSGTVESIINTTVFYDDKPLDVISGNKLSFSGILLTLGIGGTIIFSLVDNYNQQKEIINRNIFEIKKYYQKWFQSRENSLNFDPSKYNEFNSAVSCLRNEFSSYIQLNNNVVIYRLTRSLIIIIYLMGIFVMIGSDSITGLIFKVFPIVSIFFIFVIFYLFYCFKNSIFYSQEKTNYSSGQNHTIYEFTDNSQENYKIKWIIYTKLYKNTVVQLFFFQATVVIRVKKGIFKRVTSSGKKIGYPQILHDRIKNHIYVEKNINSD